MSVLSDGSAIRRRVGENQSHAKYRSIPPSVRCVSSSKGWFPGEELVLTVQGETKAIVTRPSRTSSRQPGTAKDAKHWMAPDFDAPLEDFAEYME